MSGSSDESGSGDFFHAHDWRRFLVHNPSEMEQGEGQGQVNHPWCHPTFSNKFNWRLGLTMLLNWLSCSRKYSNNMATRLRLLLLTPRILLLSVPD